MDQLPLFREPPLKLPSASDIHERTIRRWTLTGKLPATKLGSQFQITLADLEPFLDKRPPDTKELLARIIALEAIEDVQASQASRLTDLERQVFMLQAQRITALELRNAELEARIADIERSRRRRRKPSTTENATGGQRP